MFRAFAAASLSLCLVDCGLQEGERFGRPGATPGTLRIRVAEPARELDPARAQRPLDRAVARQIFATLVDPGRRPRLATSWDLDAEGRTLTLALVPGARFSDGTAMDADAVVWSWRRALLRSTAAADLSPLHALARGRELAERRLLRVARAERSGAAPWAETGPAADGAPTVELAAGTTVLVVDSNERRPCCGKSVPLRRAPGGGDALGALQRDDVGAIIGARTVGERRFLLLRSPAGPSGWVDDAAVVLHVPAVSLLRVVDRGDGSAALRVGPDVDAPARQILRDDDVVEVLSDADGWLQAVDLASGQMGFVPARAVDALMGERQWLKVKAVEDGRQAWLPARALAFDPGALGARAVDASTLAVDVADDVSKVLDALADPVMAVVPPHAASARGRAWTEQRYLVTSGGFHVAPRGMERDVLVRSDTAFERARVLLDRVELVHVADPVAALHLYRTGELDALLDGLTALPPAIRGALVGAADWVETPDGGALVAPEVQAFSPTLLELRGVEVRAP